MKYYVSSHRPNGEMMIGPYDSCDEASRVAENIIANRSDEQWRAVCPGEWKSRDGLFVKVVSESGN